MKVAHDLILFDLDGTLSDPVIGFGRSINYALGHFGYPPRELDELAAFIGPPIDEAFKTLTGITYESQIQLSSPSIASATETSGIQRTLSIWA